jgi:hypothetical protein
MTTATRTITAFLDGPDRPDISNPIHSTEVATQYGFRAALVGGVTVYGWTVPAIIEALGPGWLERGWADVSFRRPVYPGDGMAAAVTSADGRHRLTMSNQDGEACIAGEVGRGEAPFLDELGMPGRLNAEERPGSPRLTRQRAGRPGPAADGGGSSDGGSG